MRKLFHQNLCNQGKEVSTLIESKQIKRRKTVILNYRQKKRKVTRAKVGK